MVANLKTKGFQVCDSRTVENFSGLWQISFNMILPQTSNTIFIHKWHEEITYEEDTVYLRDNINLHHICLSKSFQKAGSFSKDEGCLYKGWIIKVYWNRPDFALDDYECGNTSANAKSQPQWKCGCQ